MTQYDNVDEDREIERLKSILRDSERQLQQQKKIEEPESLTESSVNDKKRKRKQRQDQGGKGEDPSNNEAILSPELLAEASETGYYMDGQNPLVILPSKKKKKRDKKAPAVVQLTPEEIREAKAMQKKTARKLQQLEARAAQRKKRVELYKKLEENQVVPQSTLQPLLLSSGKLSRKETDTKKQALKKILNKEKAGLSLTDEEKALLYPEYEVTEDVPDSSGVDTGDDQVRGDRNMKKKKNQFSTSPKKNNCVEKGKSGLEDVSDSVVESVAETKGSVQDTAKNDEPEDTPFPQKLKPSSGIDFAAQMMASLSKLTDETKKKEKVALQEPLEDIAIDAEPEKKYVPTKPTVVKTAASLGLRPSSKLDVVREVLEIKRPVELEKSRLDLPVTAMEFEIMDAIRNNDVTIICGETGSGKSTQVPAFLYEAGMSVCPCNSDKSFLIGITQPRRVAAVSTAKRVCYEMGQGNGQSIKSSGGKGNLVAYTTRYESAGVGEKTRIQFMTDGILLSEIQNDLLLRRYSVIVLDESHERNLNTDVLIGLLSVALPLRKKAAEEDPNIVPLKLVLMSATLRVEDFTENKKLFPFDPPAVVKVPGRTFPVTIHHSKVTELDDYETIAFRKICKIHRKLPHGGILVFLTGKAEIIRMVRRLRNALCRTGGKRPNARGEFFEDVGKPASLGPDATGIPREMDDEELDAEDVNVDDYDGVDDGSDNEPMVPEVQSESIPSQACILPLYSLLSADEQAKVFAPVPDGHRLIVIATNVAETSITIPGISYVVDTGRHKCRNYNSGTGVASYDVMWISKASADQRAGRAGRTGPGHCYRLYSSSLYSRHMDPFALPEVLTRPLEDVVLAMKAMKISDVSSFPFPTPPDRSQIDAAVKLLANIGCVDVSTVERDGGDGIATRLGLAVSKLPLGVRYAKMLLVAAQAGILDYAIVVVAVLSEASLFSSSAVDESTEKERNEETGESDLDDIDKNLVELREREKKKSNRWTHSGGDVLAAMLAVGACTYAGRAAGGASEAFANRKFCEENGLNYTIMNRIQKMRSHLANMAKNRLSTAEGIAAKTGGFSYKMAPPNKLQETLLIQSIASGLLDRIALLATPGSLSGESPIDLRSAYIGCCSSAKDPLFLDRASSVYTRDYRQLPRWICYDSILRKTAKDGTPIAVMKNITPIESSWIGEISKDTRLLTLGPPLASPPPTYDTDQDAVLCSVTTKFGTHGWEINPVRMGMYEVLQSPEAKSSSGFVPDDSFRWFARFLLEGKVMIELTGLEELLNDSPALITRKTPSSKVTMLVSSLAGAGIDSRSALRKHWAEQDDKFLFKQLKNWIKREHHPQAKKIWIDAVRKNIKKWEEKKD